MPKEKSRVLIIDGLEVLLTQKAVKNINLRVTAAAVKVSAPRNISELDIRRFVKSKIPWVLLSRERFKQHQEHPTQNFAPGSTHFFLGTPYILQHASNKKNHVRLNDQDMIVHCLKSDEQKLKNTLEYWYRQEIKQRLPSLIDHWQKKIQVQCNDWGVKKMRTRWGSCNISEARIWLNLELIKYPQYCLEYVVVHELVHLIEKYHNRRFFLLMDKFLPDWQCAEEKLKQPLT